MPPPFRIGLMQLTMEPVDEMLATVDLRTATATASAPTRTG